MQTTNKKWTFLIKCLPSGAIYWNKHPNLTILSSVLCDLAVPPTFWDMLF